MEVVIIYGLSAVELKRLIQLTKETDSYYIGKRNISAEYNPKEPYNFADRKNYFNSTVRQNYESLHKTLLYTDTPQKLDDAMETFMEISNCFADLGE